MEKLVKERLGKYEIRSVLGRGAMGTVYEGWDPVISRRVAIKTVRLPDSDDSEEREQLERFQQEAQAAGRLQHPNIVGVFDYAETAELAYIVMEFVDGRTLKAVIDGGARPELAEIGRLMDGLLTGLAYSHGHGVIHRDIKPANIIVTAAGQVKIADFGIARIESSTMTQLGSIMGTPAYMSPEQFQGGAIDARTDIYSAGVVLFQLLTGKRPFEGSMATIMHAVLNGVAPQPSALDAAAPRSLDAIVARAIARAPDERYPDAEAFNRALQAAMLTPHAQGALDDLLGDDPTVIMPGVQPGAPKARAVSGPAPPTPPTRSRLPLALAGIVALAVLGGGAFWVLSGREGPHNEPKRDQPGPGATDARPPDTRIAADPSTPPSRPAGPDTPAAGTAAPLPTASNASRRPPPEPPAPAHDPAPDPAPNISASNPASVVVPPVRAASDAAAAPPAVVPTPVLPIPVVPPPIVTPPAVTPPVVTAMAAPSPEAMRRAVASALRSAACSFATGDERTGDPVLQGTTGAGTGARALHAAVQDAAPGQVFDWRVAEVDDRYCATLDLLRPYARPFAAAGRALLLSLADGRTDLVKDERLRPRVTLPEGPSYLQLDYFASDGTVTHLQSAKPGPSYPTDAAVELGDPRPGFIGWGVDAPFGTDLLVAIASSAPLFRTGQVLPGTADAYLRDLRTVLAQVTRTGGRVSASILPVHTRPKP